MTRRHLHVVALALAALAHAADAGPFRFAVLSDTHIGNPTGAADLRLSVAELNERTDLAFVLLSGDITEYGSTAQLREARAILDSLRAPWHIIPGNHDTKWSESGSTAFRRIFGADRFLFTHGGILFAGLHQGPVMRMGDGHFAPEDLAWFDSAMATVPADRPLVFVTHYGLDPGIDNWYEMTDRLRRRNTLAVIHGHGHRDRASAQDGLAAVMVRSNLRARADRGGYTVVDVRADSMVFSEKLHGLPLAPAWHVVDAAVRAEARGTPRTPRPDFAVNETPGSPVQRWAYECGATVTTSPGVSDGLVIVGDALGRVRALDLDDGSVRWTVEAGGAIHSSPAAAGGLVVFGSADGIIHCLNAADGRTVWTHAARGPVLGAPVIDRDTVFIGASDSTLRALDLRTGRLLWEYHGLEGFVEARPLVADGRVVFGAWDTHLYALDRRSGGLLWRWSNSSPSTGLSPAACWPVASAGRVFIVAPDRYMTALDAVAGSEVWRSKRYQVREAIGISADARTVFARTMRDTVIAVLARPDSMETEWVTDAGFGYDIAPCMLIEHEGEVVVGTKNGLLVALDRAEGAVVWKHKIGVTVLATPVPVPGGMVVADLDGRVVRLERMTD